MPDFIVTSPDGKESFHVSAPDEAQGAREAAAGRTMQAVHPEGGRKEGAISAWIDSQGEKVKKAIEDAFHHPEGLVNAGPLGVLKLAPTWGITPRQLGYGRSEHYLDIFDEVGNKVGWVKAQYNSRNKNISIDMIQSETPRKAEKPGSLGYAINPEAHSFGHADTRSLLREAKREFPEAETVSGFRVTGARQATGQLGGTTIPLPGSTAKMQPEVRPQRDSEIEDWTMRQWESAPHSLEAAPESLSARGPSSLR